MDADAILDRRRLKRRLVIWRSIAALAVAVSVNKNGNAANSNAGIPANIVM